MWINPAPAFHELFEAIPNSVPPYLTLLNLGDQSGESLLRIHHAMLQSYSLVSDVEALLGANNWHAHLVAACATALGARSDTLLAAMWRRFDGGTWVQPQLAVAALLSDPQFAVQARTRIESLWSHGHSGKAFGSLLACAAVEPTLREWADEQSSRDDVQALLRADFDDGFGIARYWHNEFNATVVKAGLCIPPRE